MSGQTTMIKTKNLSTTTTKEWSRHCHRCIERSCGRVCQISDTRVFWWLTETGRTITMQQLINSLSTNTTTRRDVTWLCLARL